MWIEIRRIKNRTEPNFVLKWFADFFSFSAVREVDPTRTSLSRPAKARPDPPGGPSHTRGRATNTPNCCDTRSSQWWINCVLDWNDQRVVVFLIGRQAYIALYVLSSFCLHSGQVKTVAVREQDRLVDSRPAGPHLPRGPISISHNMSGPYEAAVVATGSTVVHAHSNTCKNVNQQEDRLDNDVQRFLN